MGNRRADVVHQFFRFAIVGGSCFGINLLVLLLCVEIFRFSYLAAMAVSIFVAYSLGWAMNRRWTFKSKDREALREYLRYFAANGISISISLVATMVLVSGFGAHYLVASASVAIVMMVLNFFIHRGWTFN